MEVGELYVVNVPSVSITKSIESRGYVRMYWDVQSISALDDSDVIVENDEIVCLVDKIPRSGGNYLFRLLTHRGVCERICSPALFKDWFTKL